MSLIVRWLALLVALAACAWVVARAPIATDIAAFLPGPATPEQRLLAEQLRDGIAARLVLIGVSVPDEAQSEKAARVAASLAVRLRSDPHFTFVVSGDPKDFEREQQLLFDARYLLSPQIEPAEFTTGGLRAALDRLERRLTSAIAPLVRPMAPRDPTGEMIAVVERLAQRPPPRTRHGVWFTADGRTAIVLAQTRNPGFNIDAQEQAQRALQAAFAASRDAVADAAEVSLQLAGPGVFAVESRARIERDARRLSILATILIAGLLLSVLRSPRFLLLAAVPVGTGALAGLAVIALAFGEIHGITLGFGLTLIGEAVDYAIYVHLQRAPPGDARGNGRLWRALLLAVLSSAAGFLAMILSGFRGLAQLGVFSLVGIVVSGAVARYHLPALLPPPRPHPLPFDWPPARRGIQRAVQAVIAAALVLAVVQIAARGSGVWIDSLSSISPLGSGAGALDARLRGDAALPEVRWLIALERPNQQEALEQTEALRPTLEKARESGALVAFDSPADVLPSERTQRARQAALPERAALQAALASAVASSNFAPNAFAPFVDDVEKARAGPLLTPAYYAGSGLGQRLTAQLVARPSGSTAVLVTVHGVDEEKAAQLRGAIKAHGATLIDLKDDVERLLADYRRTALWAALAGGALIVLLLVVQMRNARVVLRIGAALAAAVLVTAGTLVHIEGSLTLFHLVALLLVAGIGSNYAIFFCRLPADSAARRTTLASVALASATTFIAFVLLATSTTPVLHMIGTTVAIGTLAGLAASAACAAVEPPDA
ncbi:MAG TPA: MMPL family transporter [Burkholderiaceae bacterium]|nr:MMPL family transporter [Burkholderiaceae bacterium]